MSKAKKDPAAAPPEIPGLEEAVLEVLRAHLQIRVTSGGFTDPNSRTIKVLLGNKEVCSGSFDVSPRPEYEG